MSLFIDIEILFLAVKCFNLQPLFNLLRYVAICMIHINIFTKDYNKTWEYQITTSVCKSLGLCLFMDIKHYKSVSINLKVKDLLDYSIYY